MNAALWLAVGTAAGVLVGVTLANRSGGQKLLRRISGALRLFDGILGQRATGNGQRAADVPFDEEVDDDEFEDDELDAGDDDEEASAEYEDVDDDEGFDPDEEEDPEDFDSGEGWIDERVLAAFEQDPILAARDIEIDEPEPAVITLRGRVATGRDAAHAVTIARGVPGVDRVENYIKVRKGAPASPPPEESDA